MNFSIDFEAENGLCEVPVVRRAVAPHYTNMYYIMNRIMYTSDILLGMWCIPKYVPHTVSMSLVYIMRFIM